MTMSVPTTSRSREERTALLARADTGELLRLADECLAESPELDVVRAPETGMVLLTVREPVESIRFHLGEVLVTRCEVRRRDRLGWAMRMGSDPAAALAAAVLDAEREADGPSADAVDRLCDRTAAILDVEAERAWDDIAPTIVDFEEMD